jgi:hypothetical protein
VAVIVVMRRASRSPVTVAIGPESLVLKGDLRRDSMLAAAVDTRIV